MSPLVFWLIWMTLLAWDLSGYWHTASLYAWFGLLGWQLAEMCLTERA